MILRRLNRFLSNIIGRIDISFNKKKYLSVIAFMLILTTYFPIVYKNIPGPPGSHHFYVAIWFGSILVFYPKLLGQKLIIYILFYGLLFIALLLNTLWVEMTDWNKEAIKGEFYVFIVAISIIFYFLMAKDYEGLARIVKWSLVFIGITAILSIYAASINPNYARLMTSGKWESLADQEYFEKAGAGGYAFASALVALFPMLIYFYRNNKDNIFSKKVIIFFGLLCFFTLVQVQFFSNILLSVVVIVVSLLGRKGIRQSAVIISFSLIFFLVIPKTIYGDLLVSISSFFDPESNVYYKLNDMADYLVLGDRYATGSEERAARYPLLIEAFIGSPIFGYYLGDQSLKIDAGAHLYWMNRLTVLGLFGFIPFLIIFFSFIKFVTKYFNKEFTFYFLISVFAVLGLGLMKALAGRELWFTFFILLPGMYFLPLLKNNNKNLQKVDKKQTKSKPK